MDTSQAIRNISLFRDLTDAELGRVASLCERRANPAGTVLLEEAVRGPGLFCLVEGRAAVMKQHGSAASKISQLQPGDHFGEMSLFTDRPTSASIRADDDTVCLFIAKEKFRRLLDDDPALAKKILWVFVQSLSGRLAESDRKFAEILREEARTSAFRHLAGVAWMQTRIIFSYLLVWFRRKIGLGPSPEALSRIHRRNALRFKETAFRLKGVNIKMGQIASMQAHILPKEFIEEFRAMRDAVTPTAYPLIASQIQGEFGVGPLDLFAEFDPVPIAAASMGQVHAARLPTGEKVVVKVLHPGLERSVEIDLGLQRLLISTLARFVKKFDLRQLMVEMEDPLRKEMDLQHEARATEEIAKEMAPLGIKIPRVYWRYTSRRMLTLEFIDGCKIDDFARLDEWKIDRKKLMTDYMRSFLRQAFEGGFFHADPHPANVLCTREGQLCLLDFGMVKRLPDRVRDGLFKEILGGFFNNPKLYADSIIERDIVAEPDREKLEAFARRTFADEKMRAMIFDHDFSNDNDAMRMFGAMADLLNELETFKMPQDQLMLMRALSIVTDVVKEVVPAISPSQLALPILMPQLTDFMRKHPEYAMVPGGAVTAAAAK